MRAVIAGLGHGPRRGWTRRRGGRRCVPRRQVREGFAPVGGRGIARRCRQHARFGVVGWHGAAAAGGAGGGGGCAAAARSDVGECALGAVDLRRHVCECVGLAQRTQRERCLGRTPAAIRGGRVSAVGLRCIRACIYLGMRRSHLHRLAWGFPCDSLAVRTRARVYRMGGTRCAGGGTGGGAVACWTRQARVGMRSGRARATAPRPPRRCRMRLHAHVRRSAATDFIGVNQ